MKVCWATDYAGIGNSYGYSVQNAKAREALAAAGVTFERDAALVVHVAPGHLFEPVEGRLNVLYTAWETEVLPPRYVAHYARADAVVVTASFLMDVVRRRLPDKPVYLCPLGVDTETYDFRRRRRPLGKPFRFLWVGAPNARKGWELVVAAFAPFLGDRRVELYLKTTVTDRVVRRRNVVFDSRRLPARDLAALYHSAHCFLLPSFGEGFGLTLAEAMSTGLPVIYTPWSSLTDLAPVEARCGYPVRYRMVPVRVRDDGGLARADAPGSPGVPAELAQADIRHLTETMAEVIRRYPHALKRGERAARRIRRHFTWRRTGQRLARILMEVQRSWRQAETCAA